MPVCFSCGKTFDKLSPTGLCSDCAVSRPSPRPFHNSPVSIAPNTPASDFCKHYLKGVYCELFVYSNRVEIKRNKFTTAGSKTIPFSSMTSVQFKEAGAFFNGFIQFGILGGNEARDGIFDAVYDENSIVFLPKYNSQAKTIKDYVEKIILDNQQIISDQNSPASTSVASELLQFKQLLDMGAITQAEFDAQKRRLLGM